MLSLSQKRLATMVAVAVCLLGLGVWGLDLQARQTRDVTRKLDLEDIETSLRRSLVISGTLPPEDTPTWCGVLGLPAHQAIRDAVNHALRQTEKYRNPAKPFPTDLRFHGTDRDYVYHKTSPVSFELLAELEADQTNARVLADCGTGNAFDYAIVSPVRFSL